MNGSKAPLWRRYTVSEAPLWRRYTVSEAPLWRRYTVSEAPLWRRNAAGTIVLGAALTYLAATQWWPDWSRYRATVVPEQTVARGESVTVDGRRWQVDSVRRVDDAPGIPTGAAETVVALSHTGIDSKPVCAGVLTDGTRRWGADPFPATTAEGGSTRCELAFQIPASATPTAVDITRPDGRILLRLLL